MRTSLLVSYLFILFVLTACYGPSSWETNGIRGDEIRNTTYKPAFQTITPSQTKGPPDTPTPNPTSTDTAIPKSLVSPTSGEFLLICSPLESHSLEEIEEIISAPYDPPPMGRDERHQGVDLAYYRQGERNSILGVGVQAVLPGRVVSVINDQIPYGYMVIIETTKDEIPLSMRSEIDIALGESLYHLYAHFGEAPEVELGEQVACGQRVGEVGNTGYNIVNPHLHIETRLGPSGASFPVMSFYNTRATPEEMENYRLWRMSGEFRHFDPMTLIRAYLGE